MNKAQSRRNHERRHGRARSSWSVRCGALGLALCAVGCATVPPAPIEPPVISWEQKLTWMMRLEDQRLVRDPNPPPPVILVPAATNRPAVVAPPPPSDLLRLLEDPEGRVRRRAALALGRVGLPDAVAGLTAHLASDDEFEVRQMSAFALGLIGDVSARPALLAALKDPNPVVQGRAAEALGLLGDRADAPAVSDMVRTQIAAGALRTIQPDDLGYPLAPEVEATRLGLFALVRLGSYDALAAAALAANGAPVSSWWPVAYALQRIGDPRAAPALLTLLNTPGRYTAAFAARGLGVVKAAAAAAPLRQIVADRQAPPAVIVQAVRALAALQDPGAADDLIKVVTAPATDNELRLEAIAALGTLRSADALDLMLDLFSDPEPALRGAAVRALVAIDPDTFLLTLSGLDPDRDWTVRAAQATALGTLPADRSGARLAAMLADRDQRVVPAVLAALVTSKSPDAERLLLERLRADDFVVRAAAAAGLADLKSANALAPLFDAYHNAVGDSTYVARAAFLTAADTINPQSARPLLEEALRDRDWAVRERAAMLLAARGSTPNAAATIRPATGDRPVDDPALRALIAPTYSPHAFVDTDRGTIEIELAIADAPQTVANFIALAGRGFFNGVAIHRVVPDFVVQDGDPRGDGEGGPGYTIRDELNQRPFLRGTVGMALDWEDTGGSQFFITHSPQPHLDARYTVFGHVVDGMDVVDRIVPRDVIQRVRIWDGVSMTPITPTPTP